jgi:hypothetical protein
VSPTSQSQPRGKQRATFDHFVNCLAQSAFSTRHNFLVSICAEAARSTGLDPQLESLCSKAPFSVGNNMQILQKHRMDVTVAVCLELKTFQLDISVASHRQHDPAIAIGCSRFPLHAARGAARDKHNKYKDSFYPDTEVLIPLIAETSGAIHPNFAKFFATIGTRVNNMAPADADWTTPSFTSYWMARTSVALRSATAQALQRLARASLARAGRLDEALPASKTGRPHRTGL